MELILFAIIFFIVYFWVFSSTGAIVASIFRLRTATNYTNLIIGCFTYFCLTSFAIMPLEFIYTLNYVVLVYYLLAINVIYVLALLILIRWWFHVKFLRWEHLWFIIALILFLAIYFLKDRWFTTGGGDIEQWKTSFVGTDIISRNDIILTNRPISADIQSGTNLWLANAGMWLLIFKGVGVDTLFNQIIFLIDPMLFAAFFVTIVAHFINHRFSKLITGIICLIALLAVKILLYYFGYNAWTRENMFYNLIITIILCVAIYYDNIFRMRFMPLAISLIIASYNAFDWSSTYLILFVIYVLGWVSLLTYGTNFLKDLMKFAFIPFFVFLIYNIAFGTLFLIFIFVALIVVMLIAVTIFYRRYIIIHNMENWIFNHRKLLIFLVPAVFFFFAIILFLSSSNFNFDYWAFEKVAPSIYDQIKGLTSENEMSSIFIIVSFVLLGLSIVWICFRDFTKSFQSRVLIDFLAILITTFFNPFTGRFLVFIFQGTALANNAAVILTTILIMLVLNIANLKIKKIKNVAILNNCIKAINHYKLSTLAKKRHKIHVKRYNNIKIRIEKAGKENGRHKNNRTGSAEVKGRNK